MNNHGILDFLALFIVIFIIGISCVEIFKFIRQLIYRNKLKYFLVTYIVEAKEYFVEYNRHFESHVMAGVKTVIKNETMIFTRRNTETYPSLKFISEIIKQKTKNKFLHIISIFEFKSKQDYLNFIGE